MTEKEKAIELVEKFKDIIPLQNNFQYMSKQCALIASKLTADTIALEITKHGFCDKSMQTLGYWNGVTKEIKSL